MVEKDMSAQSLPCGDVKNAAGEAEPSAVAALAEWFREEAKGATLAAELEKAVLQALESAVEAFRSGERNADILRRVRQHNTSEADYRRYKKNAEAFALAAFFLSEHASQAEPSEAATPVSADPGAPHDL